VEARLAEVEGGYGDTLYELRPASVRTELRLGRVLTHLSIDDVTDDEVDEALDTDRPLGRARYRTGLSPTRAWPVVALLAHPADVSGVRDTQPAPGHIDNVRDTGDRGSVPTVPAGMSSTCTGASCVESGSAGPRTVRRPPTIHIRAVQYRFFVPRLGTE
jgi:hypothetical protein